MYEFNVGDKVVYPSHGVGEIVGIDLQDISGIKIRVYVINLIRDRLMVKVPVNRATASGLRPLMDKDDVSKIYATLQGKAKMGNKMWSRRAQDYETKINSGDVVSIAEVLRDLHKNTECDRSYSERTIYESALNRLACELAALHNINYDEATSKLIKVLNDK